MKKMRTRLFAGILATMTAMSAFTIPARADEYTQTAEEAYMEEDVTEEYIPDVVVVDDCGEDLFIGTEFSDSEYTDTADEEFLSEEPAEENVTEETAAEEPAAEETVEEGTAAEEPAAEETTAEETAAEETTAEETTAEETTAEETTAEETTAEEIAAEETVEEGTAAEEPAAEETTAEETTAEETTAEETTAEETTAEETTAEETTAEETTAEETTAEETTTEETAEETPAGENEESSLDEAMVIEDLVDVDDLFVSVTSTDDEDVILGAAPVQAAAAAAVKMEAAAAEEDDEEADERKANDEALMKIAGTVTELGLDALGDAIPGGKFIIGPLKAIFGDKLGLEGEDPVEKLANAQQKNFDKLNKRISDINDDMEKYTKYLGNKTTNEVEKKSLRDLFQALSSNTKNLSIAITSIMDADYSMEEKLLRIADLTNGYKNSKFTDNIMLLSDSICSTMSGKGTKIDMDMYQAILNMCKENTLFDGEAHEEAMRTASVLMEQYLYANALLLQCQNAVKDLANLTPEQMETINSNPKLKAIYDSLMEQDKVIYEKKQYDETVKRINKGATSYKKFSDRDVEGNRFNNRGTLGDETIVFDIDGKAIKGSDKSAYNNVFNKQYFTGKKLTELVDYIKKTTGGKSSIAQFLRDNHVDVPFDGIGDKRYIIVDPNVTVREDSKPFNYYGYYTHKAYVYHVRETIKVIDINDPECKVQELVVRSWDHVDGHPTKPSKENVREYKNRFFTIGSHVATEKDNYKKPRKVGNMTIYGPRREYTDVWEEHARIPQPKC